MKPNNVGNLPLSFTTELVLRSLLLRNWNSRVVNGYQQWGRVERGTRESIGGKNVPALQSRLWIDCTLGTVSFLPLLVVNYWSVEKSFSFFEKENFPNESDSSDIYSGGAQLFLCWSGKHCLDKTLNPRGQDEWQNEASLDCLWIL